MTEVVLEFSGPRTGSSVLGRMLSEYSKVHGLGEVFHRTDLWEKRTRADEFFGAGIDDALRARLGALREKDPAALIGALKQHGEDLGLNAIQMKIFPRHLTFRQIDAILKQHTPTCYLMYRAPIDMYVSICKAQQVGSWGRVDTTEIRPTLQAKEFLRWHDEQQTYFQAVRHLARKQGLAMPEITYEDIYLKAEAKPLEVVTGFYTTQLRLDLGTHTPGEAKSLTKQDKSSSTAEKVANWDAFVAEIAALGAEEALNRFDTVGVPETLDRMLTRDRWIPARRITSYRRMLGAVLRKSGALPVRGRSGG